MYYPKIKFYVVPKIFIINLKKPIEYLKLNINSLHCKYNTSKNYNLSELFYKSKFKISV